MVWNIRIFDVLGRGLGWWSVGVLCTSIKLVIMKIVVKYYPAPSG